MEPDIIFALTFSCTLISLLYVYQTKKGQKRPLRLLNLVFLCTPLRHTFTPSGCDALYLSTLQNKSKLPHLICLYLGIPFRGPLLRLSILGHPLWGRPTSDIPIGGICFKHPAFSGTAAGGTSPSLTAGMGKTRGHGQLRISMLP